jgi:nucleoside-diphosphate-sugar epimerase
MRVFVTGATGVVGRRLVPLLVAAGHEVTAVARRESSRRALERAGATPVLLDLFSPPAARAALARHDAVVNLATHIPHTTLGVLFRRSWRENDRIRSVASSVLVDAAVSAGAERFVQESFAPLYPDSGDAWIDETAPLQPVAYNRSVLDAERSASRFAGNGRSAVVLRFAAFYGPDAFHVPGFIDSVKKGRIPLPGPPEAFVSFVSHDDAATAAHAALSVPSGTYNVAEDDPLPRGEAFAWLARTVGVGPPAPLPGWVSFLMGPIGALSSRSLRISNRRFRNDSVWRPRYPSVREGWPPTVLGLLPRPGAEPDAASGRNPT